ncbi:MAG: EthD family reductase, partial [Chloroflexi bacterium]|nr:EthD family reductase [Chloroflexota bacterium]MCI0649778.1 EthD family reductase [Chloroflexota bacterium]
MSTASAIVLYPQPTDRAEFDRRYQEEHVPLVQKMENLSSFRVLNVRGSKAPYYRVVELVFPSMETLQAAFGSAAGQATAAHANEISTGGPITVLLCHS